MENPGERVVGDYLRYIKQCDFIDFNVPTKLVQGEIDVIGVHSSNNKAYICEVATHLTTGIQYVNAKQKRPDTAERLIKKFVKDIAYGKAAFPGYEVLYMLWSPVVRRSNGNSQYDQFAHLKQISEEVEENEGVKIKLVINEDYMDAVGQLRMYAGRETKELKSPVMRFLQIEEWSRKNCAAIAKGNAKLSVSGNVNKQTAVGG